MAVIDIIVICVLAVFGIVGLVKGFLNTLISLFSNLASLAIAVFCAKPVSAFLDKTFGLVSFIAGKIAGGMGAITPFSDASADALSDNIITGNELKKYLDDKMPSLQERAMKLFIDDNKTFTLQEGETAVADANKEVVTFLSEAIAKIAALVITAVVVFILLRIAVLLLAKLFDALTKNKAISGLDRIVGMTFGLIKGALLVCIVLGVFYLIANSTTQNWINNSVVTKWIYKYVTTFVDYIATKYNLPSYITGLFPQLKI